MEREKEDVSAQSVRKQEELRRVGFGGLSVRTSRLLSSCLPVGLAFQPQAGSRWG